MFNSIIVIGYGIIAKQVLSYVYDLKKTYNYNICYVEHEIYPFNTSIQFCQKHLIEFHTIKTKEQLSAFFEDKTDNACTLIISACNNYIFTPEIVNKENVKIINFHNALLPDLPGRNAPTWAIFENYRKTGITWHYVDCNIDQGEIIIQKEYILSNEIRAYELSFELMKLAEEAFKEIFEEILNKKVITQILPQKPYRKIYKSTDIPNNGIIDLTDSPELIFKILRSMDYGSFRVFPFPTSHYNSRRIQIINYKIVSENEKKNEENTVYLRYTDDKLLRISYKNIDNIEVASNG